MESFILTCCGLVQMGRFAANGTTRNTWHPFPMSSRHHAVSRCIASFWKMALICILKSIPISVLMAAIAKSCLADSIGILVLWVFFQILVGGRWTSEIDIDAKKKWCRGSESQSTSRSGFTPSGRTVHMEQLARERSTCTSRTICDF